MLEDVFNKIRKSPADQVPPLCKQAAGLYKGPFLPSNTILPWIVHRREMLKSSLLRMLITTGRHYEQAGDWERAAEYYQRGMDTDHLAE
jgi:two-component SAPR family response regulator